MSRGPGRQSLTLVAHSQHAAAEQRGASATHDVDARFVKKIETGKSQISGAAAGEKKCSYKQSVAGTQQTHSPDMAALAGRSLSTENRIKFA